MYDPQKKQAIDCNDLFLKNNPETNWQGRGGEDDEDILDIPDDDEEDDWRHGDWGERFD